MGGCGGNEKTGFGQLLLWEGLVVLNGLNLDNFHFGRVWWSSNHWLFCFNISTLGGCGSLVRADFGYYSLI